MSTEEIVVNPKLVEAMHIMRKVNSPETISNMINEVLNAKFVTPIQRSSEQDGEVKVQFHTITVETGESYLMAYTDWQQVHRWRRNGDYLGINVTFDDLAQIVMGGSVDVQGFIINPFGENVPFEKEVIEDIVAQKKVMDEQMKEANEEVSNEVYIGDYEAVPEGLLEALAKHFADTSAVKAAFLRYMIQGSRKGYLLALDYEGNREEIFKQAAEVAIPFMVDQYLDMIPIYAVGEGVLEEVEPFYQVEGYVLPELKTPSAAVIEDIFDLEDGSGCVLGCQVVQEAFHVNDRVEVITAQGHSAFTLEISAIEVGNMKVQEVNASAGAVRCGIFVDGHHANEFYAGLRLFKAN